MTTLNYILYVLGFIITVVGVLVFLAVIFAGIFGLFTSNYFYFKKALKIFLYVIMAIVGVLVIFAITNSIF